METFHGSFGNVSCIENAFGTVYAPLGRSGIEPIPPLPYTYCILNSCKSDSVAAFSNL
jgi:hypothetical protein